jgi:hypothetical protein
MTSGSACFGAGSSLFVLRTVSLLLPDIELQKNRRKYCDAALTRNSRETTPCFRRKSPCFGQITGETSSYLTAHTTIQPSQTGHFVGDSKEAVFVGISPVSSPDFRSLWTSAVSRADFWPAVAASKIPFRAARFRGAKGRSAAWKSGISGGKNAVSSHGPDYCEFSPSASNCGLPQHRAVLQRNAAREATFDRGTRAKSSY